MAKHMMVTRLAVCSHCLVVKPLASENCDPPFSTMYSAQHTLHLSASGLSALSTSHLLRQS